MKYKRGLTVALSCAILMFFSGCYSKLPTTFPGMDVPTGIENPPDITPVNFYFDSIENAAAIDYSSVIASGFMQAVISTNRSTFSTTDYHVVLENGEYSIVENDKPLEDLYLTDDGFYVSTSTELTRESSGILNLLFDEEEPLINMDEVNVIFTDLSEKDIDKAARIIRDNYLSGEEYNACFLTVTMKTKEDYNPFYICSGNNSVIEVNADGLGGRFFYLIMLGPTVEVASYVYCLKANLNDSRLVRSQDYSITDYDYTQQKFDIESDLNTDSISYPNAEAAALALYAPVLSTEAETVVETEPVETFATTEPEVIYQNENEEMFKTHVLRLDSMNDYFKQDIWHLAYDKKNTDGLALSPKGFGSKSLDFSLQANIDLNSSINDKNIHYVTLDKKSDGTILYKGLPEASEIDKDDIFIAFGAEEEIKFYQVSGDGWELLDSARVSRFFKEVSTDNGRLSLISDNTDEGGINDLYADVPVYQVVIKKNYTLDWVDNRAYIIGQEFNGLDRYRKTYNLRQFYSLLFGVSVENREGNVYVDETVVERNEIGHARILITDIG